MHAWIQKKKKEKKKMVMSETAKKNPRIRQGHSNPPAKLEIAIGSGRGKKFKERVS